ncbi:MAG: 30S ribosomal protein S20 [Armatimonadetes bacterium]|nr:30S ribosomal protein S20 [Armatimonadota bacterium]
MPNIKSVIKDVQKSRERERRNTSAKSAIKTMVKKTRIAIDTNPAEANDQLLKAISLIDRVEDKGIIHRNTAARRKSRLMKRLNKANAANTTQA